MLEEKKYYDKNSGLIIFCKQKADNKYWDNHWENSGIKRLIKNPPKHRFFKKITLRYLKPPAKIIEGGCGMGDKVIRLSQAGYETYGIDFAEQSVIEIKKAYPYLNILVSDVKSLPFKDDFFDGYWSLGVIEHFFDGYDPILNEMERVIKKGGFLFLTFPMMSPFRKRKAYKGKYLQVANTKTIQENFYQYALNPESVIDKITSKGFSVESKQGFDSLKGIKDEINFLSVPIGLFIKKIPGLSSIIGVLFDKLLGNFFGHMMLIVFKKQT
ncbi:MAG: S-adenosylmethionine (SAM)-dependent methyltransferase [uncultured bacterium]|nr:MAG: S-adenosylmethionine (SAM)-dependent methyltransferase [uncultured bacterium]